MTNLFQFKYSTLVIKPKGRIANEYNPLYNYRTTKGCFLKDAEGHYLSSDRTQLDYALTTETDEVIFRSKNADSPSLFEISKDIYTQHKDTLKRFFTELGDIYTYQIPETLENLDWKYGFGISEVGDMYPLVYELDGIIQDLVTGVNGTEDVLNFDLEHPVLIACLQSYDGSTNLILNDGKNAPRLINTRFTPLENNTYERVDRRGNTDTNLYDESEFALDASLTKRYLNIPQLSFNGLTYGGALPVGMYVIYVKLSDADGNETDVVAESGNIPVYIGNINSPKSIRGGLANEISYKSILLLLTNIDTAYDYVSVYYTRISGTGNNVGVPQVVKVLQKYRVQKSVCAISLTGNEPIEECSLSEITYEHVTLSKALALAVCLNMLFLGNVSKANIDYDALQKLSLNFLPFYNKTSLELLIGCVLFDYDDFAGKWGYYNALNVYNAVGYWPGEIYRFGVVYILNDGSLSPVFNIRGIKDLPYIENLKVGPGVYSPYYADLDGLDFYKDKAQKFNPYTNPDSSLFIIDNDSKIINLANLENCAGVVTFPEEEITINTTSDGDMDNGTPKGNFLIYNLVIKVSDDTLQELKQKHGIKGYFIVRLKRIPQVLALALAEGYEPNSGTPVLYLQESKDEKPIYLSESFLKEDCTLQNDGLPSLIEFPLKIIEKKGTVSDDTNPIDPDLMDKLILLDNVIKQTDLLEDNSTITAICPDFEVNLTYYNTIFSGGEFPVRPVTDKFIFLLDDKNYNRHLYCNWNNSMSIAKDSGTTYCNIVSLPDSLPIIKTNGVIFRGLCGTSESIDFVSVTNEQLTEKYPPVKANYKTLKSKKKSRAWLRFALAGVAVAAGVAASIFTAGAASGAAVWTSTAALAWATAGLTAASAGCAMASASVQDVEIAQKGLNIRRSFVLRGIYGPYLGLTSNTGIKPGLLFNIYVPGSFNISLLSKFQIRFEDLSPYFAVTPRVQLTTPYESELGNTDSIFPVFRGDCYISTFTHRLNRNFLDPDAPCNDIIVDPDTWKSNWDPTKQSSSEVNRGDVNAVLLGLWVTFLCRTSNNLAYRDHDASNPAEVSLTGNNRSFYPLSDISLTGTAKIADSFMYNLGYSSTTSQKGYMGLPNVPYIKNTFQTRIIYSNPANSDAFKNGFREFDMISYRDYPLQYGGIKKIIELRGNLLVIFEHGIGVLLVNQKALLTTKDGESLALGAAKVLPDAMTMISTDFGTLWPESICSSQSYVYGIDTVAKKIWRISAKDYVCEVISDFKVQKFLNDNITFTERELSPIIGIRNVKTHYNAYKHDIMFTYYDDTDGFEETVWNLCYNEYSQTFTTFYSWVPSYSANINNIFFSYDRNASKWIAKLGRSKAGKLLDNTENLREYDSDADGVCLDNVIIDLWEYDDELDTYKIPLHLQNKPITKDPKFDILYKYSIERDNFGNHLYFTILADTAELTPIISTITANTGKYLIYDNEDAYTSDGYYYLCISSENVKKLRRKLLNSTPKIPVILLNIQCAMKLVLVDGKPSITGSGEVKRWEAFFTSNLGYYTTAIAVTFELVVDLQRHYEQISDNTTIKEYLNKISNPTTEDLKYPKLRTDLWKHGQAGIIDILDKIKPCYWYGKQHPFEFEMVVGNADGVYKLFTNIQIMSNNVIPESIHYTFTGDTLDFAKDKKNMYIRQEATKAFYLLNGSDILYDHKIFKDKEYVDTILLPYSESYIAKSDGDQFLRSSTAVSNTYLATLFPLLYSKLDTFNEIEYFYKKAINHARNIDYVNLSGGEILYDAALLLYDISNHIRIRDIKQYGRLRGNALYINDHWEITLAPLIYLQKNENWDNVPPISLGNAPVPEDFNPVKLKREDGVLYIRDKSIDEKSESTGKGEAIINDKSEVTDFTYTTSLMLFIPKDVYKAGYTTTNDIDLTSWELFTDCRKELRPMDTFLKIKVRYPGDRLTIVKALNTIYNTLK